MIVVSGGSCNSVHQQHKLVGNSLWKISLLLTAMDDCWYWHKCMFENCTVHKNKVDWWVMIHRNVTNTRHKHYTKFFLKRSETQTLRAGCSKAESKNFALSQTLFPGARDGQNLISWRWSLPLPTNPVWWGSMHAISSYCGIRATHIHTNTPTHRQDRLQYTVPQLASVQCNKFIQT